MKDSLIFQVDVAAFVVKPVGVANPAFDFELSKKKGPLWSEFPS